jgi:hypothetical protein
MTVSLYIANIQLLTTILPRPGGRFSVIPKALKYTEKDRYFQEKKWAPGSSPAMRTNWYFGKLINYKIIFEIFSFMI